MAKTELDIVVRMITKQPVKGLKKLAKGFGTLDKATAKPGKGIKQLGLGFSVFEKLTAGLPENLAKEWQGLFKSWDIGWAMAGGNLREFLAMLPPIGPLIQSALGAIGTGLTKFVTLPLLALGGIMLKVATGTQTSLKRMKVAAMATGQSFDAARRIALRLGFDTTMSFSEAALAVDQFMRSGMELQDLTEEQILSAWQLSKATGTDLAKALEYTTRIQKLFKKEGLDVVNVADMLARASFQSGYSIEQMGQTIVDTNLGAWFTELGWPLKDLLTTFVLMGKRGISLSKTSTVLRSVLKNLIEPSKEVQSVMEIMGLSVADLTELPFPDVLAQMQAGLERLDEPTRKAALNILGWRDTMPILNILLEEYTANWVDAAAAITSGVTAKELAAEAITTVDERLREAANNIKTAMSEAFLPYLEEYLVPGATKLAEWTAHLQAVNPEMFDMALKIGTVLAVAGPFLIFLSKVTAAVQMLAGVLAPIAGPLGLIVAAAAVLPKVAEIGRKSRARAIAQPLGPIFLPGGMSPAAKRALQLEFAAGRGRERYGVGEPIQVHVYLDGRDVTRRVDVRMGREARRRLLHVQ